MNAWRVKLSWPVITFQILTVPSLFGRGKPPPIRAIRGVEDYREGPGLTVWAIRGIDGAVLVYAENGGRFAGG